MVKSRTVGSNDVVGKKASYFRVPSIVLWMSFLLPLASAVATDSLLVSSRPLEPEHFRFAQVSNVRMPSELIPEEPADEKELSHLRGFRRIAKKKTKLGKSKGTSRTSSDGTSSLSKSSKGKRTSTMKSGKGLVSKGTSKGNRSGNVKSKKVKVKFFRKSKIQRNYSKSLRSESSTSSESSLQFEETTVSPSRTPQTTTPTIVQRMSPSESILSAIAPTSIPTMDEIQSSMDGTGLPTFVMEAPSMVATPLSLDPSIAPNVASSVAPSKSNSSSVSDPPSFDPTMAPGGPLLDFPSAGTHFESMEPSLSPSGPLLDFPSTGTHFESMEPSLSPSGPLLDFPSTGTHFESMEPSLSPSGPLLDFPSTGTHFESMEPSSPPSFISSQPSGNSERPDLITLCHCDEDSICLDANVSLKLDDLSLCFFFFFERLQRNMDMNIVFGDFFIDFLVLESESEQGGGYVRQVVTNNENDETTKTCSVAIQDGSDDELVQSCQITFPVSDVHYLISDQVGSPPRRLVASGNATIEFLDRSRRALDVTQENSDGSTSDAGSVTITNVEESRMMTEFQQMILLDDSGHTTPVQVTQGDSSGEDPSIEKGLGVGAIAVLSGAAMLCLIIGAAVIHHFRHE